MAKVQKLQTQDRSKPNLHAGAGGAQASYRGYSDDFTVELRPTGHPSAPYVGLLRYTELMYSCPSAGATDCTVASRVPVTRDLPLRERALVLLRTEPGPSGSGETAGPHGITLRSSGRTRPVRSLRSRRLPRAVRAGFAPQGAPGAQR